MTSGHGRLPGVEADFLTGVFFIVAFFASVFWADAVLAGAIFSLANLTLDA